MPNREATEAEEIPVEQPEMPPCDIYVVAQYKAHIADWESGTSFSRLEDAEEYIKHAETLAPRKLFRLRDSSIRPKPEEEKGEKCPKCNGVGEYESGNFTELDMRSKGAMVKCDCTTSPAADEVRRHINEAVEKWRERKSK